MTKFVVAFIAVCLFCALIECRSVEERDALDNFKTKIEYLRELKARANDPTPFEPVEIIWNKKRNEAKQVPPIIWNKKRNQADEVPLIIWNKKRNQANEMPPIIWNKKRSEGLEALLELKRQARKAGQQ